MFASSQLNQCLLSAELPLTDLLPRVVLGAERLSHSALYHNAHESALLSDL